MIARLLISTSPKLIKEEIEKVVNLNHPDVYYFPMGSKLGIAEARKIKEHFSLKPYSSKGRIVVLEDASNLTAEAQNALLKTLEELPAEALFIMGADSDTKFLPTILSRCEIISLQSTVYSLQGYEKDIEELVKNNLADRFEYIEKLKDKEDFLRSMVNYFHSNNQMGFLKELLQAEEWANQNVNIRAILEYLMLVMP